MFTHCIQESALRVAETFQSPREGLEPMTSHHDMVKAHDD